MGECHELSYLCGIELPGERGTAELYGDTQSVGKGTTKSHPTTQPSRRYTTEYRGLAPHHAALSRATMSQLGTRLGMS